LCIHPQVKLRASRREYGIAIACQLQLVMCQTDFDPAVGVTGVPFSATVKEIS
jgi:hypothetical protein